MAIFFYCGQHWMPYICRLVRRKGIAWLLLTTFRSSECRGRHQRVSKIWIISPLLKMDRVKIIFVLHIFSCSQNFHGRRKTQIQSYDLFIYMSLVFGRYSSTALSCSRLGQELKRSCCLLEVHKPKEEERRVWFLFMLDPSGK